MYSSGDLNSFQLVLEVFDFPFELKCQLLHILLAFFLKLLEFVVILHGSLFETSTLNVKSGL